MESTRGLRPRAGDVAGLAIVLIAATAVTGLIVSGPPKAPLPGEADAAAVVPSASAQASPASGQPPASEDSLACGPSSIEAPTGGRWLIYRAEYGTRGATAYLRLKLRRAGDDGSVARVSAQIVPSAEVESRTGLPVPAPAGSALVVQFDGPVQSRGQFGGGGAGKLGRFVIASGAGGSVYVIAALDGERCFTLDGGAWQSGQAANTVEIVVEID